MFEKMLDQNRISQYHGYQEAQGKVVQAENALRAVLRMEANDTLTELTDAYAVLEREIMLAAFREGILASIALIDDLKEDS